MRTVDYSTRGVISAGRVNGNTYNDQTVKFTYTGVPLSHLCNLFFPFFLYEIRTWAEETFATVREIPTRYKGKQYMSEIVDPMSQFTPEKITKMLSLYIKSPDNRLDPIMVKVQSKELNMKADVPLILYQEDLGRKFTLLDLIYITATKIVEDKHVYVTRYPVNNFQSIFPSRIKILSTYKTIPLQVNNKYFPEYPLVTKEMGSPDTSSLVTFIDTIIPHNTVLEALGADYDGNKLKIAI